MSKYIEREYSVIVEPDFRLVDEDTKNRYCEDIKLDIERHVDGLGSVYVSVVENATCSFCGAKWETYDEPNYPEGFPVCCKKAQDEFNKEQDDE